MNFKTEIKLFLRDKTGFEIIRVSKSGDTYEKLCPTSSYSPWNLDENFKSIYETVKNFTLVDIYRAFELWDLSKQLLKKEGDILEVGVWRGGTGAVLCKSVANTNKKVFLADTFTGIPTTGQYDDYYRGGEHSDSSVEVVEFLIKNKLELNNFEILKGKFPEETSNIIKDKKFSLCHIDVDSYNSAKETEEFVWQNLVSGGVVVYDDYGFTGCSGVTKLVDDNKKKQDRLTIYNLNGHAIVIKI